MQSRVSPVSNGVPEVKEQNSRVAGSRVVFPWLELRGHAVNFAGQAVARSITYGVAAARASSEQ